MPEEEPRHPLSSTGLRASDDDRERVAAELREHAVAGRLDTDELEQRVEDAYAARTTAELDAVRRDLPAPPGQATVEQSQRRAQLTRQVLQEAGGSLGAFAVCAGVWLATGAHGFFWPVVVLLFVAAALVKNAWALFGPAPDLDAVERELEQRRSQRSSHRHGHRGGTDRRHRHDRRL
jgi:hypothetical protein